MTIRLAILIALVFLSALAVVYSRHESRRQFVELQRLEKQRDAMNVEWGRLQIEQATWGTHGRVEEIAGNELQMMVPPSDVVVLVRP